MINAIIAISFLAAIGLLNWRLQSPCVKCKMKPCDGDVTFTHSTYQCKRDHCNCRGGWKALLSQIIGKSL